MTYILNQILVASASQSKYRSPRKPTTMHSKHLWGVKCASASAFRTVAKNPQANNPTYTFQLWTPNAHSPPARQSEMPPILNRINNPRFWTPDLRMAGRTKYIHFAPLFNSLPGLRLYRDERASWTPLKATNTAHGSSACSFPSGSYRWHL